MTASDDESASVELTPGDSGAAPAGNDEGARLLAELAATPAAETTPTPGAVEPASADTDVEHFTPHAAIVHALSLHGRTLEESRLPGILLATFHNSIYRDLVKETSAEQAPQTPEAVMAVAQGKVGETPVAVRKFGIGAPGAVATLEELIALGARDILVVGTGGSLQPTLPIGSIILPTGAIREEGTSFHYVPAGVELGPDPTLAQALAEEVVALGGVGAFGPVWTTDAPYREMRSKVEAYSALGVLAVEMEAAALFALAQFRGVRLAIIMTVSDELFHEWRPGFHTTEYRAGQKLIARAALRVAARLGQQPAKTPTTAPTTPAPSAEPPAED